MRHPYIPEPGENGRYQPSYGMDGGTQSQPAVEYTGKSTLLSRRYDVITQKLVK